MEFITLNWKGGARKVKRAGRDYLVAPLTLLVPGVLDGSKGPLLYPAEEVENSTDQWNGMPVVVNHPAVNGTAVSARDPDLLEAYGVGTVYRSTYAGRLQAEGWFDVLNAQRVDPRLLEWLDSNTPFELSTGLFTVNEAAPQGAVHSTTNAKGKQVNKPYSWIARAYKPDHLAVLPDGVGACSIDDGCGVLVNAKGQRNAGRLPRKSRQRMLLELVRTLWPGGKAKAEPVDQTALDPHSPKTLTADLPTGNALSHDQIRNMLGQALRAKRSQADPYCYVEYVFDDYFVYEDGSTLYRQDYERNEAGVTLKGDPVKVIRQVEFLPATNTGSELPQDQATAAANAGDPPMPLTPTQRNELVTYVTANCSCWKDGKADLEKLSDGQLQKLKDATPAIPPVPTGNTLPPPTPANNGAGTQAGNAGQGVVTDPRLDQLTATVTQMAQAIQAIVQREQAAQDQAKQSLIGLLAANVQEDQRAAKVAIYNGMTLDQLAFLANERGVQQQPITPAYWGGAAGGVGPRLAPTGPPLEEEPLVAPVINWDDRPEQGERHKAAG